MNLGTTRALRGPNIWSQLTVLEVEIDMSAHIKRSTQDIDIIRSRAASLLNGLATISSSSNQDEPAESSSHLSPAMSLSELLARTIIDSSQRDSQPRSADSIGPQYWVDRPCSHHTRHPGAPSK